LNPVGSDKRNPKSNILPRAISEGPIKRPTLFARHFFYSPFLMQALRLARPRAPLRRSLIARSLATTANSSHAHATSAPSSSATATTTKSQQSIIPLSNVEAQWVNLSEEERLTVHEQLEELQKKDWKTLSIDEKKAGG
jgi:hypothetical protein